MEVGAVKQSFNNELILLKKKLNQARIQIIHKLTRKAKTLTEKKAPEPLKAKLKRKAESAVNEVLMIKKIKPKDLARFAVTHTGQLNDYLNKPNVDQDKACARLLLHKALQDKYKLIRTRFSSIPIEDLLMSREERKKLKKEAREKQKNKRKEKEDKAKNVVNAEGVWDVEDVDVPASLKEKSVSEDSDMEEDIEDERNAKENGNEKIEESDSDLSQTVSDIESRDNQEKKYTNVPTKSDDESDNQENNKGREELEMSLVQKNSKNSRQVLPTKNIVTQKNQVIKAKEKSKQNKNKNLNEKLLSRKFKKDSFEVPPQETKIVDPFFITSTGENYLSIVEPRPPDEVKEVHKQGNRKLRRAAMFGHVPKVKPKYNDLGDDNNRVNRNNGFNKNNNSKRFDNGEDFGKDKRNVTSKRKFEKTESLPEKLHPSWEAKKRQSGIQPFQGKRIVFDEN